MNEKQKQSAQAGSIAIQSAGDTNINMGLSPGQMREIMECLSDQLPKYAQIAVGLVEQRLKAFEKEIIDRFEKDLGADPTAFADPDFQFLLREAQKTFARSGEENTVEILSDLLVERSKVSAKTRKRLSLSKALSIADDLTEQEIAELVLSFALKMVKFHDINSPRKLAEVLNHYTSPFIKNVSDQRSSYIYLESVGCAKLSMGEIDLFNCLFTNYPDAFLEYCDHNDLIEQIGQESFLSLVNSGIFDRGSDGFVRRTIHNFELFSKAIADCGIIMQIDHVEAAFQSAWPKNVTKDRFCEITVDHFPGIRELFRVWDETPMRHLELSAVGVALGFVTLKRVAGFGGDIDVWIN